MKGFLFLAFVLVNLKISSSSEVIDVDVTDQALQPITHCSINSLLTLRLTSVTFNVTLRLTHNAHIRVTSPLYILEEESRLRPLKSISSNTAKAQILAYQSREHGAAVLISCNDDGRVVYHDVEGMFHYGNKVYTLKPISRSNSQHFLTELRDTPPRDSLPGVLPETPLETFIASENDQSRNKRDASLHDVHIDILIVADFAVYKYWKNRSSNNETAAITEMQKYFAHLINGADLRYKNMTGSSYNINIRLIGYIFSRTANTSLWTEKNTFLNNSAVMVNAQVVLTDFRKWVLKTELPPYDHIMLFTGYDLISEDNGFRFNVTTGLAYRGGMCSTSDGHSSSVVEDHGSYQSVRTIAHELGHSLGAGHDDVTKGQSCSALDRYIMAPGYVGKETEENKLNPFHFSKCSIAEINEFIKNKSASASGLACLRNALPRDEVVANVSGEMPGQLDTPDEQCKHFFGDESYMCRGENFPVKAVCRSLFCSKPGDSQTCVGIASARGTSCGNKKWCLNGQCEYNEKAPEKLENCPLGQHPGILDQNRTCQQLVDDKIHSCYDNNFRIRCCESCVPTSIPDCMYGDKVNGCQHIHCLNETTRRLCCQTCYEFKPTTPSATPTTPSITPTTPDNKQPNMTEADKKCSEKSDWHKSQCYEKKVYKNCAETCDTLKNEVYKGCAWGDRKPLQCSTIRAFKPGSVCARTVEYYCCEMCGNQKSKTLIRKPVPTREPTNTAKPAIADKLIISTVFFVMWSLHNLK